MKKLLIFALILIMSALPIFGKDKNKGKIKKTKTEVVVEKNSKTSVEVQLDKDAEKFKADMRESVLEFISDLEISPDSCYVPFKK